VQFLKERKMPKKILITGGPVHAYLDAVKIITNRFRGGLMCELAYGLVVHGVEITYLTSRAGKVPEKTEGISVIFHDGIEDYKREVLRLAPEMDAVVLGAAVANLIPAEPFKGKFPSHNYKVGDRIPIDFTIAPRIIDMVKSVAPKTHLFGFKLLSGVSHEELIQAAYGVLLESKATAVFANDAETLLRKYAVTKERGVHPLEMGELPQWIVQMIKDEYYRTESTGSFLKTGDAYQKAVGLVDKYRDKFVEVEGGLIFGTVAVRSGSGFVTTSRGKNELSDFTYVRGVDHRGRVVHVSGKKATLNAPLLATIFEDMRVGEIIHYHEQLPNLPTFPYAPPGTVRDSIREFGGSFNIAEHGCYLVFDKEGNQL